MCVNESVCACVCVGGWVGKRESVCMFVLVCFI